MSTTRAAQVHDQPLAFSQSDINATIRICVLMVKHANTGALHYFVCRILKVISLSVSIAPSLSLARALIMTQFIDILVESMPQEVTYLALFDQNPCLAYKDEEGWIRT